MGCISSKVIARSISYHEERKQGSERTANGIPLLEDLIISAKLLSRSFSSNSSPELAIEPINSETVDKLEVPTTLGQEEGKQIESDNSRRSKSWHAFPEYILSSLAQENSSGFEDKHNLSSKDDVGSRSFHTVEEYEDMLNRKWMSKSIQENKFNDEEDEDDDDEFTSNANNHKEDKGSTAKKMQPHSLHNKSSLEEESKIVKEISIQNTAPESTITSSGVKVEEVNPTQKTSILENAVQGVSTIEKGNKRKALAKRLESLRIPSNIELPAIGSLREWIPASGIYSPGTYVTPKFGSYSLMNIRNENESSEDYIFSPELVSVFEQCMQKLEADEQTFLKQIIEDVEEENDEVMEPQERTPPSIQA